MFERYTERARRVLFFARYEASQLGSVSIETEHLLLGLLRDGKGLSGRLFDHAHASFDGIRAEVQGRTTPRGTVSTSVEIPFSAEVKRALQFAAEESDRLLHTHIGTEHLLLGLLRVERSLAASILMDKGMHLAAVRGDIVQLLNSDRMGNAEGQRAESPYDAAAPASTQRPDEPVPSFVPSPVVHIMHSQREPSIRTSHREWIALGYGLKRAVAAAWHADEARIDVAPPLLDGRFDIVLSLPRERKRAAMEMLVRHAIEDQIGVTVTLAAEEADVYVATAPAGPGPALRPRAEPHGIAAATRSVFTSSIGPNEHSAAMFPIGALSLSGVALPMLCATLETILEVPVVNQTGLAGLFDLEIPQPIADRDRLLAALRDEAGLILTRERRPIDKLVVRPHG